MPTFFGEKSFNFNLKVSLKRNLLKKTCWDCLGPNSFIRLMLQIDIKKDKLSCKNN